MIESCIDRELGQRLLPELFRMENGTPVTPENVQERRQELLTVLQREVYGYLPAKANIRWEIIREDAQRSCAGKAVDKTVSITVLTPVPFTFSVRVLMPKAKEKPAFVVFPNFRSSVPDEYLPAEELIDRGVGFATFCYKTDITSDSNDFSDGFAGCFYPDGVRKKESDCGKIALWSYCCMRTLDYVLENESVDLSRIGIAGHSRLGKTALLTGAMDVRFTHVYSNDSGCSGAALSRGKFGESVADITRVFPYWFCPKYASYAEREALLPLDQHFLLAAIAPRHVMVGSAVEDIWADPVSEYLCCCAAEKFWELYGKKGFEVQQKIPDRDDTVVGEHVAYQIRPGVHFFSRTDWNRFLDFLLR